MPEELGLFRFFMGRVLFAPRAVFFERELGLQTPHVFVSPVVEAFAGSALQAYEIGLRHKSSYW